MNLYTSTKYEVLYTSMKYEVLYTSTKYEVLYTSMKYEVLHENKDCHKDCASEKIGNKLVSFELSEK